MISCPNIAFVVDICTIVAVYYVYKKELTQFFSTPSVKTFSWPVAILLIVISISLYLNFTNFDAICKAF